MRKRFTTEPTERKTEREEGRGEIHHRDHRVEGREKREQKRKTLSLLLSEEEIHHEPTEWKAETSETRKERISLFPLLSRSSSLWALW
ncbi:MAG: hypothetical protein JO284_12505 [Planctomycetaceae bacterium]|nr:hypothetical protein [Planctomycetaceae bacterium]MBV8270111.1 hypothetical protein [Planctomycetaceae bacterium]